MTEETIDELDDEIQFDKEEIEGVYALLERCGDKGASLSFVAYKRRLARSVASLILDGLERAGRIERIVDGYCAKERGRA